MKTNIKMRVTPEQSKKVQEICFEKGIEWLVSCKLISHLPKPYLIIENSIITYRDYGRELEHNINIEEVDADLFIRTNGTCEENTLNYLEKIEENTRNTVAALTQSITDGGYTEQHETKETYKPYNCRCVTNPIETISINKDRITIKNQREELDKLNLKLQKCISLEEHNKIVEKINKDNVNYLSNNILSRDKEIEKLKAVIEYLESKVNKQDNNKSDKLIWTMSK